MRRALIICSILLAVPLAHGSKFSKFIHKMDAEEKARQQQEWQQDMNFSDISFRLNRRFVDNRGESCREYIFRSRSNPFRHGEYMVCDERASYLR